MKYVSFYRTGPVSTTSWWNTLVYNLYIFLSICLYVYECLIQGIFETYLLVVPRTSRSYFSIVQTANLVFRKLYQYRNNKDRSMWTLQERCISFGDWNTRFGPVHLSLGWIIGLFSLLFYLSFSKVMEKFYLLGVIKLQCNLHLILTSSRHKPDDLQN